MIKTERMALVTRDKSYFEDILKMKSEQQMKLFAAIDEHRLEIELERANRIVNISEELWKSWDLVLDSENEIIGSCGFHNIVIRHSRAEIGYAINDKYRRKGLMTEAVNSIVNYGFENMSFNRIEAFVNPINTASLKLLRGLNFKKEGLLRQHHFHDGNLNDSEVYSMLKEEYKF